MEESVDYHKDQSIRGKWCVVGPPGLRRDLILYSLSLACNLLIFWLEVRLYETGFFHSWVHSWIHSGR